MLNLECLFTWAIEVLFKESLEISSMAVLKFGLRDPQNLKDHESICLVWVLLSS